MHPAKWSVDKFAKLMLLGVLSSVSITSCDTRRETPSGAAEGPPPRFSTKIAAAMPVPHTNNAVTVLEDGDGAIFYSFNGLRADKTYQDASQEAYACALPAEICNPLTPLPVREGRLASVAVALDGAIYIFGGYTVAEDGGEVSTPEVFAFNPETEEYKRRADMPTPVDDAVAFPYAGRYIYLVSGWYDDGNVSLVQAFDTWEDRWFRASDYPGAPVFGHAGGGAGNKFIIADGVAVIGVKDGRRQFGAVDEVWLGKINPNDPAQISWDPLPPHPGGPFYRMAAAGDATNNRVVFYGGADNPYNYDGIGYDGVPAQASDVLFAFDLEMEQWIELGRTGRPSMDHRGLMIWDGAYWTLGGMDEHRNVTGDLVRIDVAE